MTKILKRFIAGAVCPRCGEMDKLVTFETEEGVFKECVHCDFTEKQIAQVQQSELPTRVNHGLEDDQSADETAAPIRILDPKKP